MLRIEGKFDWIYAPYAGGAPVVTALLGGHVNAVVANYSEVTESTPEQFGAFLALQARKYAGLITQANIKAD